jgi:4'-phosphopantetheinyl transferase
VDYSDLADIASLPGIAPAPTADRLAALARSGGVDLWYFDYEAALAAALVGDSERPHPLRDAYLPLMTEDERARHDRFVFAKDRLQFLATRALVRTVLSQYVEVEPTAWRFATFERGKPYILAPDGLPTLHFNLSNTRGLIVCAVSRQHPLLGCDTEDITRKTETVSIADHYFSPLEVQALRTLPAARHSERFFSYWTLKESYIKARGLGLALPLDQFSFLLDDGADIGIAFDPRLGDDAQRWRFALLRAGSRHFVAVGVDTGGQALSLRATQFVPLRGQVRPSAPALSQGGQGQSPSEVERNV